MTDHSHRVMEYYTSIDPYNTAVYLCNEDGDNKNAQARIEVMRFGYKGGDHQFYIKFPQDDHFTEVIGGISSSHGSMCTGTANNPWLDSYKRNMRIFIHDGYMLISFGKFDRSFNFLRLEARKVQPSDAFLYKHSALPTNFGHDILKEAMNRDYLKLPMDVRTITYAHKVINENIYIIVDYPTYGFTYDNHTFHVIDNGKIEKMKITAFERYRDGGTTYIKVVDSETKEHIFFSPTKLGSNNKVPTWDNKELIEIPEDDLKVITKILGIEIYREDEK